MLKKGDPKRVKNYRGISFLDVVYKVSSLFLLRRILELSERVIGDYQCDFRKEKSTTGHILAVRQILSKHYKYNKAIHLVFVNVKQVYNNIIREKLWKILTNLGIPTKIVNLIKQCNSNTKRMVRVQGEFSDPFKTCKGIRQGDTLLPVLFNLTWESININRFKTRYYK